MRLNELPIKRPYILKGGEIASEEEIKALKGKVDQLVSEKKRTHKNEK